MTVRLYYIAIGLTIVLCLSVLNGQARQQEPGPVAGKIFSFPSKLINHINKKAADLNGRIDQQTEKYLQRLARREEKLRGKLYKIDSTAANNLFASSPTRYAALAIKMKGDASAAAGKICGEYIPYLDSLKGSLSFLQQGDSSSMTLIADNGKIKAALGEVNQLQNKLQDAEAIKQFINERRQQIRAVLSRYTHLPNSIRSSLDSYNKEAYYYVAQIEEFKDILNDPDKLEQRALSLVNQLPAFQQFMKQNGQLAGLFGIPGNYGSPQALVGLQTRDQVSQLIQSQVAAGGAGGAAALQANLQSAQSQLDSYKDKLNRLGSGGGDIDMPNFKPNDQKTKTFWKRLEYGANFQTSRNNQYYPTVADLGLSVGYKLGHSNTAGLGASYKLGLGNGWNHIAFSSQGVGLRSFIDLSLRGSFFVSGGLEYNYTTPITSFRQIRQLSQWSQSGLIGLSKTVSVRSRVFKRTKLQLLWDFLSYQQVPKTQPVLFRIGYNF